MKCTNKKIGEKLEEIRELLEEINSKELREYMEELKQSMDSSVGQIIAALHRHKIERRTLVFFTSDNGGIRQYREGGFHNISDNGPCRGGKGSLYEGGHRVPAIAWWPGKIAAGVETRETTMTMDLFPTMLELAGLLQPENMPLIDGTSLLSLLLERKSLPERSLFWKLWQKQAVRKGAWKLMGERGKEPQLYNLDDDIGEHRNVAAEQPEMIRQLQEEFALWEKDVNTH